MNKTRKPLLTPEQERMKRDIEDQIDGVWKLVEAVMAEREKTQTPVTGRR